VSEIVDDSRPPEIGHVALFARFLTFGCLAFGGPVAQIAMIRRELVERERWMSPGHFNRLLAVMQVLPGPEAHELCVHLGIRARGRIGGLLAGLGFMLPGFALMMAIAWAYVTFGLAAGVLGAAFMGIQIAVIAVILRAAHRIGQHILEDRMLWGLAIAATAATMAGVGFWIVLAGAGTVYALARAGRRWQAAGAAALTVAVGMVDLALALDRGVGWPTQVAVAAKTIGGAAGTGALFVTGLKAGLLTFGGAYTAIPFVRADAVGRGQVSEGQFLDGVALAVVLPAPLVIFCTFVGYVAGGPLGALAITAGVFLPAFAFSMIFYEHLERVMDVLWLQTLLAGVAAGVVGIIAATTMQLGAAMAERAPSLWPALLIFGGALAIVYRWNSRLTAPVILALAGVAGWLAFG